jgi:hypothetical protein
MQLQLVQCFKKVKFGLTEHYIFAFFAFINLKRTMRNMYYCRCLVVTLL